MRYVDAPFALLSRRGFLVTGVAALTAANAFGDPACTLGSEQEEGPYYIDDETVRRDITEGKPGVPLLLAVRLVDSRNCAPLRNAALDVWHCDALGVYSGFTANSPDEGRGGPPPEFGRDGFFPGMPPPPFGRGGRGGPPSRQTDATRYLRGAQLSGDNGLAEFLTVYPGWYSGRAIHIHVKVHVGGAAARKYAGGHVAHTGQLFFPEDLTERVARLAPYAARVGVHRTTQAEDGVFNSQHGAEGMLKIERLGKRDEDGFRATATLAIDPEASPSPVDGFGGRGGRPRRG